MTDMTLYSNTEFGNKDAMNDFLFANSLSHHEIANAIQLQGKTINSVPIGDMGNPEDWLLSHYQVHQQEFEQLGLSGLPDLSVLDFKDQFQFYDWMQLHSSVHFLVNQTLGLT